MKFTNTKMEQKFVCKFCETKFHRENTLQTHLCVKKQRFLDLNSAGSRFGFRTFQRFYELTSKSKNSKTQQEFIDSNYYIDFVKFGNHLALLKPLYIEKFIDFVILNNIKLKDWTKDYVYDVYIIDLVKKEPAESATERSISEIIEWCDKNNIDFVKFFENIHPNEAAHMIRVGKISPWVLYLCSSAEMLMDKFNEDHAKMIGDIIEPGFWMKRFKKLDDDVTYIKSLLEQAGL